ncbi:MULTISPECIES: hypothetical protein [unclassified Okeania]|nr:MULTISPECIES: hypothetical protein [unclassified Okeania]
MYNAKFYHVRAIAFFKSGVRSQESGVRREEEVFYSGFQVNEPK